MIEFDYQLPSMHINGKKNGTYNNYEMVLPLCLTSTDARLGEFLHRLHNVIEDDRRLIFIDGKVLCANPNWIRDHVHEMKGFKHWEYDLQSFLQFIINTQREDGQYYELIKQLDDGHWKFVSEDCRVLYPDDSLSLVRLELEADIEYLVVEGAMHCYQVTGDFDWLLSVLPALEKGIDYMTTDKKRFNSEYGLVIRPFTIDTWDFTNDANSGNDRRIHADEPMSAMHGDNTGVWAAMQSLAWINEKAGNPAKAVMWHSRADRLKESINRYLWNGRFFIHQFHIGHDGIDSFENERLSLSNPYDITRGFTTPEQTHSIIEEYRQRREKTKSFAEFFSIDPPYESFKGYTPGNYVNGAISPFAAGELAKASFQNGYEEYGWDIISRFIGYAERDSNIYFLYSPDDMTPQGRGPSGWGAASLLSAVDEGLAGITDIDCKYRIIGFSPRFVVTDYRELRYITGYEKSGVYVDIRYTVKDNGLRYDVYSHAATIQAHIMLPVGKTAKAVYVNGTSVAFTPVTVVHSAYVDFTTAATAQTKIEVIFE